MRVADYLMERIYSAGTKHVFLVTGRGMLHLSDGLARSKDLVAVPVHHEQSASYAAMAYAQANERLGVCMVSTGCAGTNAVTGALCAWQDDVPCLFISGQHFLKETTYFTKLPIRTYGQQEADIVSIVKPITKYATMITNKDDVVYEIDKAIHLATTGRKGPVWIDIPLCIQNAHIDVEQQRKFEPKDDTNPLSLESIDNFVNSFNKAERPIVLIGSGVRSSHAIEELHQFLEKYNIPVAHTVSSVDIIDPERVLSVGCVSAMGSNRSANFAIQNSDFVLVLGCRLTSMARGDDVTKFAREAHIAAVDIDPYEHEKHKSKIDNFILADIKNFLKVLDSHKLSSTKESWILKCKHWLDIFPRFEDQFKTNGIIDLYHFSDSLSRFFPENGSCITDSGLQELIVPTTIKFFKNQRCIHPPSQGAMGYALPASIGVHYATEKPVIAVIGDGSVMMNLQELQTISYNKLPLKIFIINNNAYAIIRKRQKDLYRNRTIGTDESNGVSCANFKKVSEAFNIRYELIESTDTLDEKLQVILSSNETIICEVMCKENQEYIHSSFRKGADGRLVQPPIEDQSPFINRDLFLSEMIIKPIDL